MKKIFCFVPIFLFLCIPLFSGEHAPELIVESVGLKSPIIHHCPLSFVSEIKNKHLGYVFSVNNWEEDELTLVIERPLLVNGFAGCPPEQAVKNFPITKSLLLAQQKEFAYSRPVIMALSSAGYAPGEKIEIRLIDKNKKVLSRVAFIPCPIRQKFINSKAKVSFECTSLEYSMYKVYYTGFEEGEVITIESQSGHETMPPFEVTINEKNQYGYSNAVIGMMGGVSKYTVTRANGEKVVLKLPWGNQLIPYFKGQRAFGDKI